MKISKMEPNVVKDPISIFPHIGKYTCKGKTTLFNMEVKIPSKMTYERLIKELPSGSISIPEDDSLEPDEVFVKLKYEIDGFLDAFCLDTKPNNCTLLFIERTLVKEEARRFFCLVILEGSLKSEFKSPMYSYGKIVERSMTIGEMLLQYLIGLWYTIVGISKDVIPRTDVVSFIVFHKQMWMQEILCGYSKDIIVELDKTFSMDEFQYLPWLNLSYTADFDFAKAFSQLENGEFDEYFKIYDSPSNEKKD